MKTRQFVWGCLLALATLGCGGGGSAGDAQSQDTKATQDAASEVTLDCGATLGTGSLTGAVSGRILSASHAGGVEFTLFGLTGYMIGFSSQGGSCQQAPSLAMTSPLVIQMCNIEPGDHDLDEKCIPEGGGVAIATDIEIPQPGGDIDATSGTIKIEQFNPECGGRIKGSFTADFNGETVSGSFDTVSCGHIDL